MHMGFLQVIFFVFFLVFPFYPMMSSSQSLICGNNSFFIQYPFRLLQENQNPKTNPHSKHFFLKCNNQGLTVINIPLSGDFYVRDIDYFDHKIQLYDPGNCTAGRLMNLSLSNSPFMATYNQNYTFFRCPQESLFSRNFSVVDCMSNSTSSVVATSLQSTIDEIMSLRGCNVIGNSSEIPVSSIDGDFQLAWNDQICNEKCQGKSQSISILSIILICCITIAIAILATLFFIAFCLRFTNFVLHYEDEPNNTQRLTRSTRVWQMTRIPLPIQQPRPQSSPPRPNLSTDDDFSMYFSPEPSVAVTPNREEFSSTEVLIIGGKECISGPNSDSCSICLQDYTASERLRRICKCDHCFHAHCLEIWLHTKNTCPFCRIEVK